MLFAVRALFIHQAVDVSLEPGALAIELAGELQVINDLLVKHFAGDEQGNARWVGRHQAYGDAALQVINLHPIGQALRNVGVGIAGLHGRGQVAEVHIGGQACNVVLGVEGVEVLAQVGQAHALVARVLFAKLGQDAPHGLVLVVIVLELLQRGQHAVPSALGNTDGEHDEEAVQAGFFHHHAVLGQKLGHDAGGYAGFGKLPVQVHAGGDDRGLDRVQHIEAGGHLAKAVPVGLGGLAFTLDDPVTGAANAFFGKFFWAPDLEPPVTPPNAGPLPTMQNWQKPCIATTAWFPY